MMNENDRTAHIQRYLNEIKEQFDSGHAIEHAYRPALKHLMDCFEDTVAVNDPKHSEHGAPDFVFLKKSNNKIIRGYAEAKDIAVSLDKTEKTDQMQRYHGYANLFLTDYLEFRFFRNGDKYETISLGEVKNNQLHLAPENGDRLIRELEAFLDQTPEKIRSGRRLAQIMGGKARRIRDNVAVYLEQDGERDKELVRIYEMMKQMLVHDLSPKKFADMYAQTLVYGLFVARYGDDSPSTFSRSEARDLVPKSNPFLQHFFDHIVGPNFDTRLAYIVDELCEIFSVSDVADIVHKHLRIQDTTSDTKDPIIHFYEDFLQEYDSAERKKMGAYYTPVPVVKYIVRQVDKILKEEFGIAKGLASTDTVDYWIETGQDHRIDKRHKAQTGYNAKLPRVQVLDPAVGTATFLNEAIKHVHESFKGQEGRWESYVNENLLKRLYGFELMMAPYTIAHLKLGMTLKETGVENLNDRLGVYLTNTLEEGVPAQQDLLSFGLAEAVSQESKLAAQVKSERPVMIVMGNPPYSVSSNNKSKWIQELIKDYKKDLNERKINLDDDYIKFIRFAEDMIARNGGGIVAMITNNSYIDGITHRQMRKHLRKTFNKIYILDLHGSSKKKEASPDGSIDQNVFDIMQGVSIVFMVKKSDSMDLADVYHAELWGTRKHKFKELNADQQKFSQLESPGPNYFFVPKNFELHEEYLSGVKVTDLFVNYNSGLQTKNDSFTVSSDKRVLQKRLEEVKSHALKELSHYNKQGVWSLKNAFADIRQGNVTIQKYLYKAFDYRYVMYSTTNKVIGRSRAKTSSHMLKPNIALCLMRAQVDSKELSTVLLSDAMVDINLYGFQTYFMPLYVYSEKNTLKSNFNVQELKRLTQNLSKQPMPEDALDYIYATLYSPGFRSRYKEFLKTDFPHIPIPSQAEFDRLVPLGRKLRELHLMKSPVIEQYDTTFPESGDNFVGEVRYQPVQTKANLIGRPDSESITRYANSVYINKDQYFGNVPKIAWEFYIGGYQPAQKWLKDRKGRKLSDEDIEHYQKIIKVLTETDRIMKEIDKA